MKVHFLGIGGSGASAAAAIAQAQGLPAGRQGFEVTGCDLEPHNEFTTQFKPSQLLKRHSPSHLYCHPERSEGSLDLFQNKSGDSSLIAQNDKLIDVLAVTPAIFSLDPDNPELVEAEKMGIPIMTWQQFVGEYLTKDKFVIAICGTHGKTTTTAMIAQILEDSNLDPTVLLGAINPKWQANYRVGKSKYFIIEADEFNDNFLHLKPDISVVTNIEMDHPEYFKDINAYLDSFEKFLLQTKDTIVANLKDKNIAEIVKDVMKQSKVSALDFNKIEVDFNLEVPGDYNILNAKAAFQTGLLLGIEPEVIRQSLNSYTGVGRRFELIGTYNSAQIYSDFGHHPTEIKATMQAAREKFPNQRIVLIYEPHMFSRTKALFDDFVKVFKELPVDEQSSRASRTKIIITDIYPSREVDTGLISSQQLVDAIGDDRIVYHSKEQLLPMLKHHIKDGDIIFFMGAGDIDKFARELLFS